VYEIRHNQVPKVLRNTLTVPVPEPPGASARSHVEYYLPNLLSTFLGAFHPLAIPLRSSFPFPSPTGRTGLRRRPVRLPLTGTVTVTYTTVSPAQLTGDANADGG
jgi:hypothetical protein